MSRIKPNEELAERRAQYLVREALDAAIKAAKSLGRDKYLVGEEILVNQATWRRAAEIIENVKGQI